MQENVYFEVIIVPGGGYGNCYGNCLLAGSVLKF